MRCSRVEELMSLKLDGEASQEQVEVLEEHLRSCSQCRRSWESVRGLSTVLRSTPMARPSRSLVDAVMQRIENSNAIPVKEQPSPVLLVVIALGALLLVATGNLVLIGVAWGVAWIGLPIAPPAQVTSAAWSFVSIARLLGTVGWEFAVRMAGSGQETVLTTMAAVGLALAALWAHVVKNYRGVEVHHRGGA